MPMVLRKRKAREEPAPPVASKRTKNASTTTTTATTKKAAAKKSQKPAAKKAVTKPAAAAVEKAPPRISPEETSVGGDKAAVGAKINLDTFGGEIETNDGEKTTLKMLVENSDKGVVLFTYPKASTPGCTTQACLFRDSYEPITKAGLSIYGLSADSPKANTNFKTKQNLQYPLLCDPAQTLIQAIGMKKSPKGTQRGVFVVGKDGVVAVMEPGGPAATVERVKKLLEEMD